MRSQLKTISWFKIFDFYENWWISLTRNLVSGFLVSGFLTRFVIFGSRAFQNTKKYYPTPSECEDILQNVYPTGSQNIWFLARLRIFRSGQRERKILVWKPGANQMVPGRGRELYLNNGMEYEGVVDCFGKFEACFLELREQKWCISTLSWTSVDSMWRTQSRIKLWARIHNSFLSDSSESSYL